jgi:hypothetical protein
MRHHTQGVWRVVTDVHSCILLAKHMTCLPSAPVGRGVDGIDAMA